MNSSDVTGNNGIHKTTFTRSNSVNISTKKDEKTGSVFLYRDDSQKHTRETYVDFEGDGKFDSATYFQDDESGKCQQTRFDFDFDGNIDETLKFIYDEGGNLNARYTYNGDGAEGEPVEKMYYAKTKAE